MKGLTWKQTKEPPSFSSILNVDSSRVND